MNTKTRSNLGFQRPWIHAVAFVLAAAVCAIPLFQTRAANPTMGTINVNSTPLAWDGTATGTGAVNGESTCVEGVTCDTFTLTVGGTPADWAGKRIEVRMSPPAPQDDYDLVIHKTSNSGTIVDSSGNGAGIPEVAHINPAVDGVGVFTVHAIYFATTPPDQYHTTATVVPLTPTPPPAATPDTGPKV